MRVLRNCGYDGVKLHDFRATAATILAGKGVPIKQVQAYLGHKDVQMTLSYYGHLDMHRKQLLTEKMASSLF